MPAPLWGLRASRALWVSDSVMWGLAMRISVRGWKVGVDPLYYRNLEMPFLGLWLQGSNLDEVDAGSWFPFACCG